MNKKIKILFTILLSAILIFSSFSQANSDIVNVQQTIDIEKSEAYKEWETLSKEEKEKTIEPSFSNINIRDSLRRSTLNSLLSNGENNLEESFDLRSILQNGIIVKNQKKAGACWAFSYTSVLESTLARRYNKKGIQYSPMHIEYKTTNMFNRELNDGGNIDLALAYSASGYGPVYESDFSFDDVYSEQKSNYLTPVNEVDLNKTARARVTDAKMFASIYKKYNDSTVEYRDSNAWFNYKTYTVEQVTAIRNLIKRHIKENGAVSAYLYIPPFSRH